MIGKLANFIGSVADKATMGLTGKQIAIVLVVLPLTTIGAFCLGWYFRKVNLRGTV